MRARSSCWSPPLRIASSTSAASAANHEACRSRNRFASPLASSFSTAYSRIVSSIAKRIPSRRRRTRLLSSSHSERVEVGVRDRLCRLQRAAPREDRETRKSRCSSDVEQLVGPVDRRSQRLLAGIRVPVPLSKSRRGGEAFQELLRREQTCARSGQLDRQGQPLQPSAELSKSRPKARAPSARRRANALFVGERRQARYSVSSVCAAAPARCRTSVRLGQAARSRPDQAQSRRAARSCRGAKAGAGRRSPPPARLGPRAPRADRLSNELGIRERRQRHPVDAVTIAPAPGAGRARRPSGSCPPLRGL